MRFCEGRVGVLSVERGVVSVCLCIVACVVKEAVLRVCLLRECKEE